MAYEYDRFEREDGGGSFLMGLLAGTVLGAGLGMLFAPRAGSEIRNQLSSRRAAFARRLEIPIIRRLTRSATWWTVAGKRTSAREAPPPRRPPAPPAWAPARVRPRQTRQATRRLVPRTGYEGSAVRGTVPGAPSILSRRLCLA
jgi:hypothetical protein